MTGLDRPWEFQEFEVPRFQDNLHMEVVRLSVQQTGRLYLREIFPVNISVRRSQPRAILRPEGLFNENFRMTHSGIEPACLHILLTNSLLHLLHFAPGRKAFEIKYLVSVWSTQLSVELYKMYVCRFVSCFTGLDEMFRWQTCYAERKWREALSVLTPVPSSYSVAI